MMEKEICFSSGLSFRRADMIPLDDAMGPVMAYPYDKVYPRAYEQTGDGKVRFCLYYPNAGRVELRTYAHAYSLEGKDGLWTGTFDVGTGFIAVFVTVDGNDALYPGLPIGFGGNRPINYIELGDGMDRQEPTDVPHGSVSVDHVRSRISGKLERIYVYLPPGYHDVPYEKRYPVLYLQHGHGENETAWVNQGKVNFILDELIYAEKAEPMIVVMCNGMVSYGQEDQITVGAVEAFGQMLTTEIMPFVEQRYRIIADKAHRGMAGLSMGSMQTSVITLEHQDLFDYVGIFSGFVQDCLSGYRGHVSAQRLDAYAGNMRYIFRAMGDEDPFLENFYQDDRMLEEHHIVHERVIYKGGHEWKVWQRCIHDFAQRIFKEGCDG